jgi:predicted ATP-grasp superfamily ATP-dependent carboligase
VPIVPAHIGPAQARTLQNLAVRSGRALGCRHYWRVDFRVTKEGEPLIVEVNPNPDLHPEAGLARALHGDRGHLGGDVGDGQDPPREDEVRIRHLGV